MGRRRWKVPLRWSRRLRLLSTAVLIALLGAAVALGWWYEFAPLVWGAVAGACLGLAMRVVRWLAQASPLSLGLGLGGAILGLAIGALLTPALARLPGALAVYLPLAVTLALALIGAWAGLSRQRTLLEAFPRLERLAQERLPTREMAILDTTALIDGRIAHLVATGFLRDPLVVPRFVVEELRRLADSGDPAMRARGRRGLGVLNRLRQERKVPLRILEANAREDQVEARLVSLARRLKASVITANSALGKTALAQGLRVFNLNELAAALQSIVPPGEMLQVRIIQEGKEPGQGVGFLDDGTMVVVEGGQRFINQFVDVVVMRTHQTAAGRIIFAQPRG
ncbi:MAG: PIN/TRAM domain-containing protein [Dehalococcoidia bacterium]